MSARQTRVSPRHTVASPSLGEKERAIAVREPDCRGEVLGRLLEQGRKSFVEEIFDPGFRDLDPNWPSGAEGGIPAMLEKNDFYFGLPPDLQCTVLKQLVVDEHVVSYWEASGTHQGEWAGVAPAGKSLTMQGISIFTCRNGKIVEQIISYDVLGLLKQMGATSIPT